MKRAYVETNFVLELALRQEQAPACTELLDLAGSGALSIVIPAFSLLEPWETLVRRRESRVVLKRQLEAELRELGRTPWYGEHSDAVRAWASGLIEVSDAHEHALTDACNEIAARATIVALDGPAVARSSELRARHDLRAPDAAVLACILGHLDETPPVNRNWRDFRDPDVENELERRSCKFISSFVDAVSYLKAR